MKVYVVIQYYNGEEIGEIVAIYSTQDEADRVAASHRSVSVKEYELDSVQVPRDAYLYHVGVKLGDARLFNKGFDFREYNKDWGGGTEYPAWCNHVPYVFRASWNANALARYGAGPWIEERDDGRIEVCLWARDEEQAVSIAVEFWSRHQEHP